MSLKRLAVVSAVGSHNSFNNQTISYVSSYSGQLASSGNNGANGGGGLDPAAIGSSTGSGIRAAGSHHHQGLQTMRPGANLHGNVNIMLGGAMLSVVITVVCFVCYCCHRNIKKRSNSLYRQQWLETEANMEIYSVEQCYDPPPSSAASGFFLDGGSSSGGDYQALPVNVNHPAASHFPFPYHHHATLHYPGAGPLGPGLGYPNGPPPSYDAVVAQDELLLAAASRRKESFQGAATESGDCKAGAPKGTFRRVSTDDDDDDGDEPDAGEPLWRGGDDATGATASGCSCSTVAPGPPGSQVLPIYCRNCGYFVEPSSSPELPLLMVPTPVGRCTDNDHRHRCHPPPLVDYETQPAAAADTVNRNIVIDGGTPGTGKHPGQSDGQRLDAMNNNGDTGTAAAGPSANEAGSSENNNIMRSDGDDGPGGPERLTGMACGPRGNDANLIDMREATGGVGDGTRAVDVEDIRQCRIMSNQDVDHTVERQGGSGRISYLHAGSENRRQATEDQANGNGGSQGPDLGGRACDVSRQLLRENGVLRLDMSQIIDNTGLPTYEAALKLESSGYV